MMIPGIDGVAPLDKAGLLLRIGDPMQKAYELSAYLTKYASVIRVPRGEFFPPADQIAPYIKTQQELTDLLKAMITLRKYSLKIKAAQQKKKEQKVSPVKLIPKTKPAPAMKPKVILQPKTKPAPATPKTTT